MQGRARGRGGGRSARARATTAMTTTTKPDVDNSCFQFIITESSFICGYPDCGRRFNLKHNLLQHQTKEHGRQPRSRGAGGGGATTPGMEDDSHKFIVVESSHICGYPECGKRFSLKHNLLQHQTKNHGRQPVRSRKSDVTADSSDDYLQE